MEYIKNYLIIINIISFILYSLDKLLAIKKLWRIKETTLLFISFLGGSLGSLIAMNIFHHKTKKTNFKIGIPIMFLVHLIILLNIMFKITLFTPK